MVSDENHPDIKDKIFIKRLEAEGLVTSRTIIPDGRTEEILVTIIKPHQKEKIVIKPITLKEITKIEWKIKGGSEIIEKICEGTIIGLYENDLLKLFGE
ncbi:MAG: hypothetical protein PHR47_01820 [Candidatus Pacebacteria bacterium]|nr:hypothetical protein [Candidatus Paceibacterota bacterium]